MDRHYKNIKNKQVLPMLCNAYLVTFIVFDS